MKYISTRGSSEPKLFSEILLEGLAPDGGLYVPKEYPAIAAEELMRMQIMTYPELAFCVLEKFIDDIPPADLKRLINETYTKETFGSSEIVPIKKLEDGLYLLGLSEGPTLAFKDIALQLLGRLFEYALTKKGETLNILGATSGDTGSAAEYAIRGRKGIRVFMLSPEGRMSEFQRKQMYTIHDPNIFNIVIKGTFDDCQDIVKALNEDREFKTRYKLGAVNSINWARIAAQTVYYAWVSARLNNQPFDVAVPTGNFGNILAAYVAKRMGISVRKLILATNENNVLEDFFATGVYRPRKGEEVHATSSPSMDISKASNFERYIFELVGRQPKRMAALLETLKREGMFSISSAERERTETDGFIAGSSTHADRVHTIKSIYETYGELIDPHTADGVKVGLHYRDVRIPLVCLETAQPAKFAATIQEAVGILSPMPERYEKIADLPEHFGILAADNEAVRSYIAKKIG